MYQDRFESVQGALVAAANLPDRMEETPEQRDML